MSRRQPVGRPRGEVPIDRFNVRLPEPDAEWVKRRAEEEERSAPSVIAEAVHLTKLRAAGADLEAEEARIKASGPYRALAEENEQLAGRVVELRRQLADVRQAKTTTRQLEQTPRWAWPIAELLGDAEWWDKWLPRLFELMGRESGPYPAIERIDERGYVDLLSLLFPPVENVTWRAVTYPRAALAMARGVPEKRSHAATISGVDISVETRVQVWEPVVRHVAVALVALEGGDRPAADAHLKIQAEAEIMGPWLDALRRRLGLSPPAVAAFGARAR